MTDEEIEALINRILMDERLPDCLVTMQHEERWRVVMREHLREWA